MFDQQELQQLIGGEETLIDLEDLKRNTQVSGYKSDKPINLFWKVGSPFSRAPSQLVSRWSGHFPTRRGKLSSASSPVARGPHCQLISQSGNRS